MSELFYKGLWLEVYPPSIFYHVLLQWQKFVEDGGLERPFRRVVDIGAHHGSLSCLAAALGGAEEVVAYEPAHFSVLSRNVKQNKLSSVKCVNAAVLDGKPSRIRWFDDGGMQSVLYHESVGGPMRGAASPVDTVSFTECVGEGCVDYLKCDCEGGEFAFLGGDEAARILSTRVGYIDLEIHPPISDFFDKENELILPEYRGLDPLDAAEAMLAFVEGCGFSVETSKERHGYRIYHVQGFRA